MFDVNRFIIMRGLPGSGKSHLAQRIWADAKIRRWISAYVLSTDQYWYRPDNFYDFNASLLPVAHAWNITRAHKIARISRTQIIIIDNTNIKLEHIKPYITGLTKRWRIEYMLPDTPWAWDVEECHRRCQHGVPLATIQRMKDQYEPHEHA